MTDVTKKLFDACIEYSGDVHRWDDEEAVAVLSLRTLAQMCRKCCFYHDTLNKLWIEFNDGILSYANKYWVEDDGRWHRERRVSCRCIEVECISPYGETGVIPLGFEIYDHTGGNIVNVATINFL